LGQNRAAVETDDPIQKIGRVKMGQRQRWKKYKGQEQEEQMMEEKITLTTSMEKRMPGGVGKQE